MSKRPRDIGRKYLSGSKKRAIAKAKKEEVAKDKGSLDKFLNTYSRSEIDNNGAEGKQQDSNDVDSTVEMKESNDKPTIPDKFNVPSTSKTSEQELSPSSEILDHPDSPLKQDDDNSSEPSEEDSLSDVQSDTLGIENDPGNWPDRIEQKVRDYLVVKGPPKIAVDHFPQNAKGQRFSKFHTIRKLKNGEVMERP